MSYFVGQHTPNDIDWKPGERMQCDPTGDTAKIVGYESSSGNKYQGYTSFPIWWEDECWMMPHPTGDLRGAIPAPDGSEILPKLSYFD